MSPQSKQEYTEVTALRYKNASRSEKSKILDEYCATCNCHRKHAIRTLRRYKRFIKPKKGKRGKPRVYREEQCLKPLKIIWLAANQPCFKRLKAILPLWLPGYEQIYGKLPDEICVAMRAISSATIDRLLRPSRVQYNKRGRSTTKPGSLLRKQIPIMTNQWDESRPGFVEADTVAHCGESTMGMYALTLDCVDIATGWTEQRAVWGKGEAGVLEQIKDIEESLPFPLLGFDSDNGSEFLNHHLLRHFTARKQPVKFTRSRAYHSNDNAHVEQKIGPMSGNGSATTDSILPSLCRCSMNYTAVNGDSIITSFFLQSNSLTKNGSAQKQSNDMTNPKRLIRELWLVPIYHNW